MTLEELRRAIQENPGDAEVWFLLAATNHQAHNLTAAREGFSQVVALDPQRIEAHLALTAVCLESNDVAGAVAACNIAVELFSQAPQVWFSLAFTQEAAGQLDAALHSYDQALVLQPSYFDALTNRGALLLKLGQVDAAVANNQLLASKQPYSFVAQFNLGDSLIAQHNYKAAVATLGRARALSPNHSKGLLHAAFALAQLERFADAQQLLDKVQTIDPEAVKAYRQSVFNETSPAGLDARTLFLFRHYDAIERCDWREREYFIERFSALITEAGALPLSEKALGFRALAMGLSAEVQLKLAKKIAACSLAEVAKAAPALRDEFEVLQQKRAACRVGGRLRIGYLSADFRLHATSYLMERLPGLHCRDRFEIFLYSIGPDDGSEIRRAIIAGADSFDDVSLMSDAELAQKIAVDGIDILVDIGGYTQYSKPAVLALRPAPIQVSYLAYLQTSGAPWIDYALLDHHVLTPAIRKFWVEKIAYLPDTLYICDGRRGDIAGTVTRADMGLPEDTFVFCCFNVPWKIDPEVLSCWVRILAQVPSAVLWLYVDNEPAEINLRTAFQAAGGDGSRLFFARRVSHEQHLLRYKLADAFLDTFVCNAHTTAIEAMTVGIPVVTLPGENVVARVGASLLKAHGVPALITSTADEYVEMACRLAVEPLFYRTIKAAMERVDGSRLFCTEDRVRELEYAYETMWARKMDGQSPIDFDVPRHGNAA